MDSCDQAHAETTTDISEANIVIETSRPLPVANRNDGLSILKGLWKERSLLAALTLMNRYVGRAFRITLPVFQPAVFVGPESNRQILVTDRHQFSWRSASDPVVRLLRQGILVVDDAQQDTLRAIMDPPLQRKNFTPHIDEMQHYADVALDRWQDGETRDMLVEMRRAALLILMGVSYRVDFAPDMDALWNPILELLEYISPGLWILWADMPRPKYRNAIAAMDGYLYRIIRERRAALESGAHVATPGDLLSQLILAPDMNDDLIRDQLLTMLIAGHDTSTALLAWVLYLLGMHPEEMVAVREEIDAVMPDPGQPVQLEAIGALHRLDLVIKEALRLYPPIHVGNRVAKTDLDICGYRVPEGTRVMYSIYLAHRDKEYWSDPEQFCPERFAHGQEDKRPPLTYVPFGGGPRNCIGAAFAQVESKIVLVRILQRFELELLNGAEIHPHMGATLEPRPGVQMRIRRRA
ncbi:MAG: cytochrome P450 [Anaerolineales bacterium]|nr:cytochrome P450 [Anaerolineales bacterium]